MRVLYIGSADLKCQSLGGQLEKTRILYYELKNASLFNLDIIDMYRRNKIILLFQIIYEYFKHDLIVFLTSENGTKFLVSLFYWLKKIAKKKVLFIVIGNQNKLISNIKNEYRNSIDYYYFEIEKMAEDMSKIVNALYLPNCKKIDNIKLNEPEYMYKSPIRICYFSEISKRKGIDSALRITEKINRCGMSLKLDVYGFWGEDELETKRNIEDSLYAEFKGTLNRDKVHEVLSKYPVMLFYSKHKYEGVPGVILDAYESGTPVVTSDVSYMEYVVKDGITGYVVSDEEAAKEAIIKIIADKDLYEKMQKNCINEARKYDVSIAKKIIVNDVKNLYVKD